MAAAEADESKDFKFEPIEHDLASLDLENNTDKDKKPLGLPDLLTLAKFAETAQRYEDMSKFMKSVIELRINGVEKDVEQEERNLLSVAYKNVVGAMRQAWREISGVEELGADLKKKYQEHVETELRNVCDEVLKLLKDGPLKQWTEHEKEGQEEAAVFFFKMSGDYYRYLAELTKEKKTAENEDGKNAQQYYEKARVLAEEKLAETHPTRLGLALNFSVCYYEILGEKDKACDLAKKAFDAAIEKLDTLNDDSYKDSTLIMQLLRDNLTLWTSDDATATDADNP